MEEKQNELVERVNKILGRNCKFERMELIIAELVDKVEALEKGITEFEKEFDFEFGWQKKNAANSTSQWHKGALRGFEHSKQIFDRHLKTNKK